MLTMTSAFLVLMDKFQILQLDNVDRTLGEGGEGYHLSLAPMPFLAYQSCQSEICCVGPRASECLLAVG